MNTLILNLLLSALVSISVIAGNLVKESAKSEMVKFEKISEKISKFKYLFAIVLGALSGVIISFFNKEFLFIIFVFSFLIFSLVYLKTSRKESVKNSLILSIIFTLTSFFVNLFFVFFI